MRFLATAVISWCVCVNSIAESTNHENGAAAKSRQQKRPAPNATAPVNETKEPLKTQEIDTLVGLLLQSDHPDIRAKSVRLLTPQSKNNPQIQNAFIQSVIKEEDQLIRRNVAIILADLSAHNPQIGKAFADIVLTDKDPKHRVRAIQALATSTPNTEVIEALIQGLLEDRDRLVRFSSAEAIGNFKARNPALLQAVLRSIEKELDYGVKVQSMYAALRLGNSSPQVLTSFTNILKSDSNRDVRILAAKLLKDIESPGSTSILNLRLREDPDEFVRMECAQSLSLATKSSLEVIAGLTHALQNDKNGLVVGAAQRGLIQIARSHPSLAGDIVPSFLYFLEQEDPQRAKSAIDSLDEIAKDDPRFIGALQKTLIRNKSAEVRIAAASRIRKLGRQDRKSLAVLKESLKTDGDPDVRQIAALAIGELGTKDPDAMNLLKEQLKTEKDDLVKTSIGLAIEKLTVGGIDREK